MPFLSAIRRYRSQAASARRIMASSSLRQADPEADSIMAMTLPHRAYTRKVLGQGDQLARGAPGGATAGLKSPSPTARMRLVRAAPHLIVDRVRVGSQHGQTRHCRHLGPMAEVLLLVGALSPVAAIVTPLVARRDRWIRSGMHAATSSPMTGTTPPSASISPAGTTHDTRALQEWLGHSNIQNTTRYTEHRAHEPSVQKFLAAGGLTRHRCLLLSLLTPAAAPSTHSRAA